MTNYEGPEHALLDEHEPRWVAQGYRLIRHPRGKEVPHFLGHFMPDAILVGREPKLVVEVIRKGARNAEEKVRRLKALIGNRQDWRLEILYAGEAERAVEPTTLEAIDGVIATARRLSGEEPQAALMLIWAGLEAIARLLEPQSTTRPQTPGRVVELLAGAGHIAPSEAQLLRAAVAIRNQFIHGNLSARPTQSELRAILAAAEGLLLRLRSRGVPVV